MAGHDQISVFSCGQGDSILIEAHGLSILTDINYRNSAQDDDDDDALDFGPQISKACTDERLDLFVLTHPDRDHLMNLGDLFYLGDPSDWDPELEEGGNILINEIWCSNYAAEAKAKTDEAKSVLKEIHRRKKLEGTAEGLKDGNRLKRRDAEPKVQRNFAEGIAFRVLAPTPEEADVPGKADPKDTTSANSSSLVIQWTVTVDGFENKVLLCGDAPVAILERLYDDVFEAKPVALEWNILVAPHHCSRHSLGSPKPDKKGQYLEDDPDFEISEKARKTLGKMKDGGYVVSSSNHFEKENSPPHPQARKVYWEILGGGEVTEDAKKRFLCTGEKDSKKESQHIQFDFTRQGPSKKPGSTGGKSASVAASIGTGGEYGERR